MDKIEYKVTKKSEWENFKSIFLYFIIFSLLPLSMRYLFPDGSMFEFICYASVGFMFFFIPQCFIHLSYYYRDKDKALLFNLTAGKLTITDKEVSENFLLDDIKHVFHYVSYSFAEKRMGWYPWEGYNYSKIILKNGRQYIITSLLVRRLELPVGDRYEAVKLLPTLNFRSFFPM